MALTNQAIHMVYSICFPMRSHSCQGTSWNSSIDNKQQPHYSQYSYRPSLPSMSTTQATVSFRGRYFRDGKGNKICWHRGPRSPVLLDQLPDGRHRNKVQNASLSLPGDRPRPPKHVITA